MYWHAHQRICTLLNNVSRLVFSSYRSSASYEVTMGTNSSKSKSSHQPRIAATFPGDPDHGKVVVERGTYTARVPKPLLKKRFKCYLDITIGGQFIGRLVIGLRPDVNPRTCENFRALCTGERDMSYKGCKFHRIVPGFILQTGDVELKGHKKEGRGGRSVYGRTFADENLSKLSHDRFGIVSMANSGPHTNSSQFMIIVDPKGTDWLDGKHTVFGAVTHDSFQTLKEIENCAQIFRREKQRRARIVKNCVISDCGQL